MGTPDKVKFVQQRVSFIRFMQSLAQFSFKGTKHSYNTPPVHNFHGKFRVS